MTDRIAALEARLTLLEEKEAILRTLTRYGHALDFGPAEAWADCFTADGVFDIRERAGLPFDRFKGNTRMAGNDVLLAYARRRPVAPAEYQKHMMMMPDIIEISGNEARVLSYFVILHEKKGTPTNTFSGRYRDHMIRGADGVWRFRERIAEISAVEPDPALF